MNRGGRARPPRFAGTVFLTGLALGAPPAAGQVIIKAADRVSFRLGFLLQGWSDWTQDPVSAGYEQNFFLRRIRFNLTAALGQKASVYFQTDNPRLGNAGATGTKIISTGFIVQDAFLEWKLAGEQLMLDGGLFLYASVARRPDELVFQPLRRARLRPAAGLFHRLEQRPGHRVRCEGIPAPGPPRVSRRRLLGPAAGARRRQRRGRIAEFLSSGRAPPVRVSRHREGVHVYGDQPRRPEDPRRRRLGRHAGGFRGVGRGCLRGHPDRKGRGDRGVRLSVL